MSKCGVGLASDVREGVFAALTRLLLVHYNSAVALSHTAASGVCVCVCT